jgi:hypothetical protein
MLAEKYQRIERRTDKRHDDLTAKALLQQTIVQRGAKTTDGHIIEAVTLPWFDIIAAMQRKSTFQSAISSRTI